MKKIASHFQPGRRVRARAQRGFRSTGHPNGFGFRFPGWRHPSAAVIACILICCLGGASGSRAALIAEDSFDYLPAGASLHGKNGGTGWAASWATNSLGNVAVTADATGAELAFEPAGGLRIDGASAALDVFGTVNQPVAHRRIAAPPSGAFYAAYLVRIVSGSWTDTDTFSIHLANEGGNVNTLNFGLRGGADFMVRNGTGAPIEGAAWGTASLDTTYLLVARLRRPPGSTTYDQIDLWVDPGLADSNTPSATLTLTAGEGLANVSHVIIRAAALEGGSTPDRVRVDELKLATAWTDIIAPGTNGPANALPTVSLTAPPGAATFVAPADIAIEATAFDTDGSVTNVAFYADSVELGEAATAPYRLLWTGAGPGFYTLSARAWDDRGGIGTSPPIAISVLSTNTNGVISGELKKWHRVSITWDGPASSETSNPNPFRDYRLNVTFAHPASGKSYCVPGFFAADGDAANTGATGGVRWRVHFAPDEIGQWNFIASFRAGANVATNASPAAGIPAHFDGASGSFVVVPTDKTGRDLRAKGRLQYVGKHHLRFAETGEYFLKMGADSPENLLAYADFDDTPNVGGRRKTWESHAGDFDPLGASAYTWAGGKGASLLGAIRYLADQGLNAFSFIPFTLDGDDHNVFPHRLVSTVAAYQSAPAPRWNRNVVHHDRFDISKMEQWDRVFSYGEHLGMYLHFKTLETENELTMDGGNLGVDRSLYYRELIARFGYHLALNWNLGEEIDNATTAQKQAWSHFFHNSDPYRHLQVIHNGASHYDLLGLASCLTGFSRQTSPEAIFGDTLDYLRRSDNAGVPWVVAYDEQNPANDGIVTDLEDFHHDGMRGLVIWSHLLAGGAGIETYFGYSHPHNDLDCQDFRSRENWWRQCRHALDFFRENAVPFQSMTNRDALLTAPGGAHCFALAGAVYVVYLPTNTVASLDLTSADGPFSVRWFDPRAGGSMQTGAVAQVAGGSKASLGRPPLTSTRDWVALVAPASPPLHLVANDGSWQLTWEAPGFVLDHALDIAGPWTNIAPEVDSPYALPLNQAQEFFRLRWAAH